MEISQSIEANDLPDNFAAWFPGNQAPPDAASSSDGPVSPVIQNIVSTVNLECKLHLPTIAQKAMNAEYNPRRFSAVIMRIRNPKTSALIFASGKMVCTGAKTEEASKMAARKFSRIVQKIGFPVKFGNFKIQNMVGSCHVGFPVRLVTMNVSHAQCSVYEPEVFPGLIYKMIQPRVTILVFASGKIVIAGAKVKDDMHMAFDNFILFFSSTRDDHRYFCLFFSQDSIEWAEMIPPPSLAGLRLSHNL